MAIVNNVWLRGTKQKLAGTVLYQAQGRTLQRELAPEVANPRTTSQMSQRLRLANLVAFYRTSRAWMKYAFETKPQNWSDYNAFVSANIGQNAVALTKAQAAAGACVVGPYQLTQGSLTPIGGAWSGDRFITDLFLDAAGLGSEPTVGVLSSQLIANNNGLRAGDQLSFIQYIQQTDANGTPFVVCRAYEVLLDPNSSDAMSDYLPDGVVDESGDDPNALAMVSEDYTGGFAFILSRTVSGKTYVSSQSVVLTLNNTVYTSFTSAAQLADALASYGETPDAFLSSNEAASIGGSVATAPSILSVQVGANTYTSGQQVSVPIASGTTLRFNMAAEVPSTAAVTGEYYWTQISGSHPAIAGTFSVSGTVITVVLSSSIAPNYTGTGKILTLRLYIDGVSRQISLALPNQAE